MNARLNTFLTDITGYADDEHPAAALAAALKKRGWQGKRVAIDQNGWFLTINLYNRLVAECGPLLDAPASSSRCGASSRSSKSSRWRRPAAPMTRACAPVLPSTRAGASENDIASAIMAASIKAGGEYVGMEPFVTSGPALGHSAHDLASPRDRARVT